MNVKRFTTVAVAALLVLSAAPGAVAALDQVIGHPSLSGTATNNQLTPGSEGTVDLYVQNSGHIGSAGPERYEKRVQTARATTLDVSADGTPLRVHGSTRAAGSVALGTSGPYGIDITVPDGTAPGTYHLTVSAHYDYTSIVSYGDGSPEYDDVEHTETFEVPVVVRDRATFSVVNATSDVSVSQRGTYTVSVKNTGSEVARNTSVAATSASADVSFGGAGGSAVSVDRWAPNETKSLTYSAAVADTTGVRNYAVSLDVTFDDAAGITRQAPRLTADLRPQPEQTFAISDVDASLQIGRGDGNLTGTVTNTGPETVHDAALTLAGNSSGVSFDQREYGLPDLEPGESAHVSFTGGTVPNTANLSSLPVAFAVQYDNAYDDQYRSDVHEVTIAVNPHRNKFNITAADAIPAGTRGDTPKDSDWSRLTLRVTNDGDETVHDVRPSLVFDSQYYQRPIESNYRTSVIGTLEPGETENVTYAVSASATAGGTTYPLDVAVSYEEASGVARQTGAYTVPIQINESSSLPLLPIGGGAIILLGLLLGGFIWYRRDPEE